MMPWNSGYLVKAETPHWATDTQQIELRLSSFSQYLLHFWTVIIFLWILWSCQLKLKPGIHTVHSRSGAINDVKCNLGLEKANNYCSPCGSHYLLRSTWNAILSASREGFQKEECDASAKEVIWRQHKWRLSKQTVTCSIWYWGRLRITRTKGMNSNVTLIYSTRVLQS